MSNSVLQTIRPCFCGIYNCFTPLIRAFCGIHPFWRRSLFGGIILCCIYHRRTYLLGGIRRTWHGIEHCRTSFFHQLCRTYNYIRRTFFFPEFFFPSPVKVLVLVAGETFQAHDTFMQKLKLQIEPCSAENSDVILLFCPVVSRIGTDMEAAMARVTEDKPVILVFMHHCHHPSHMTNTTVQPSRSNIVQVVHCAFHQTRGLLECKENEEAVDKVLSALLRNLHAEVPQSKVLLTTSDMEKQPMAAQDANRPNITSDSEPVGEESESDQCKDQPKKDSCGSSADLIILSEGQAPEVQESNVDDTNVDMEEKPMAAQDGKRSHITNDSERPGKGTDPAELPAEVPQPDVCIDMDRKQQPISTQDTDSLNITNDNAIPGKGTDPAGEESESDQKTIVSPMEHSTGSSGELPAEVPQPDVCIDMDRKQQPISTQDTDSLNITNGNAIPGKGTDPAGEESESDQKTIVSPMEHFTGSSGGKGCLEA